VQTQTQQLLWRLQYPAHQQLAQLQQLAQQQQLWHTQRQQATAVQQLRFIQQHRRPAVLQAHWLLRVLELLLCPV
jgi:hypothetical protein